MKKTAHVFSLISLMMLLACGESPPSTSTKPDSTTPELVEAGDNPERAVPGPVEPGSTRPDSSTPEPAKHQLTTWLSELEPERYSKLSDSDLAKMVEIRLDGSEKPGGIDPLRNENVLHHLEDLAHLKKLKIWTTRISNIGLEIIGNLTNLEVLEIGGWGVRYDDKGLANLSQLKKLRVLKLTQAPGITDEGMAHIAQLPALAELDISYTKISDLGLATLSASPSLKIVGYGWALESKRWREAFENNYPNCKFKFR